MQNPAAEFRPHIISNKVLPVEPRLLSRLQGTLDDRRIDTAARGSVASADPAAAPDVDRGIVAAAAVATDDDAAPANSNFSVE